jgi:TolB-like protein/pimeloyl-ACP methyl ester carboxylesterase/Tfp pilus assembly protein PilF
MRLTVGDRLGPYTVRALLGRGGMGEVYHAHDSRLGRDVAIKLLSAPEVAGERRARFEREARVVARLNHPNILTLHDVGEHEGTLFLVTELLEGGTLRQRLERGPLPWGVAVGWASELAEALGAAHGQGIVHRDLKPENLWITRDERIKILDFGIAKIVDQSGADQATIAGPHPTGAQMLGTVGYMSPEQVRGEIVDGRSDIFSLGAVLHEAIGGRRPFRREAPLAELHAILHDEPQPLVLPAGCPPALAQLVARCLAKTPRQRFASARDLGFALQALRAAPPRAAMHTSAAPHRIAVLPFADLSPRKDQDFWCEGLAEELISALTAWPELQVASRRASFRAAAAGLDGRAVGAELGAASVLEGTVRKAEGHLRVTARLLDVAAGYYSWSQSFERRPEDVFAIQDEIAEHVSRALGILPAESDASAARLPTTLAAYELYLRARQQFHRMRRDSLDAARRLYRRAIALDPAFALAHAGLAESSVWLYLDWGGRAEDLIDAEDASRDAVARGDDLADAHLARALTLSAARQWPAADREFEIALRLQPQLFEARYFYGRSWVSRGDLERAAHWLERAVAVRPDSYEAWVLLGMARLGHAPATAAAGALRHALAAVERHLELEPDEVRPLALGAQALAGLGDMERAAEWARRARALAAHDPGSLYNIGAAFAMAGQTDEAIACLDPAIRHCSDLPWVDHDRFLDGVREDERFRTLLDAAWRARGGRESPDAAPHASRAPTGAQQARTAEQRIAYCTTRDGVRIAYATSGQGPLIVRVLGWFTHLEREWAWPELRALWERLAASLAVVRYDGRGIGLSDRWTGEFTEETRQRDLEAVLDAAGGGPAALFGISEGGWTAAQFAVEHPARVSHLVIYGGYARGMTSRASYDPEEDRALLTLMRKGWGRETPAFRQVFTSQFFREDTEPEVLAHFNEMQRASADPDTAARYLASCHSRHDGTALFSQVSTPTLVVHRRDDRSVSFEEGRYLASVTPGAEFLPLAGSAHYFPTGPAMADEPGAVDLADAVSSFVGRTMPREPARSTHPSRGHVP